MALRLNQVIAAEKDIKRRYSSEVTTLHRQSDNPGMWYGLTKTFRPKVEAEDGSDAPTFPPESKKVIFNYEKTMSALGNLFADVADAIATKDWGNCHAKANIVIDDKVLVKDVPVTYLLWLEKTLKDLTTFIEKLPVLDSAETWTMDENDRLYKTNVIVTEKTKKERRPMVLYQHTDKHPAQVEVITEDVVIGHWNTIKTSGAISDKDKQAMLERLNKLQIAVKFAREEANSINVDAVEVGKAMFDYIVGN